MKYIPRKKLSKKAKRLEDLKQRKVWSISPITRKPPNPKQYNRVKSLKDSLQDRE